MESRFYREAQGNEVYRFIEEMGRSWLETGIQKISATPDRTKSLVPVDPAEVLGQIRILRREAEYLESHLPSELLRDDGEDGEH